MAQHKKSLKKPLHVKKGDTVMVISGKDKGKTGVIAQVFTARHMVLIEGMNQAKKAVKPNSMLNIEGGLHLIDRPLHASKVMLYSSTAEKPTRIKILLKQPGIGDKTGKLRRVRICRHTQTELD